MATNKKVTFYNNVNISKGADLKNNSGDIIGSSPSQTGLTTNGIYFTQTSELPNNPAHIVHNSYIYTLGSYVITNTNNTDIVQLYNNNNGEFVSNSALVVTDIASDPFNKSISVTKKPLAMTPVIDRIHQLTNNVTQLQSTSSNCVIETGVGALVLSLRFNNQTGALELTTDDAQDILIYCIYNDKASSDFINPQVITENDECKFIVDSTNAYRQYLKLFAKINSNNGGFTHFKSLNISNHKYINYKGNEITLSNISEEIQNNIKTRIYSSVTPADSLSTNNNVAAIIGLYEGMFWEDIINDPIEYENDRENIPVGVTMNLQIEIESPNNTTQGLILDFTLNVSKIDSRPNVTFRSNLDDENTIVSLSSENMTNTISSHYLSNKPDVNRHIAILNENDITSNNGRSISKDDIIFYPEIIYNFGFDTSNISYIDKKLSLKTSSDAYSNIAEIKFTANYDGEDMSFYSNPEHNTIYTIKFIDKTKTNDQYYPSLNELNFVMDNSYSPIKKWKSHITINEYQVREDGSVPSTPDKTITNKYLTSYFLDKYSLYSIIQDIEDQLVPAYIPNKNYYKQENINKIYISKNSISINPDNIIFNKDKNSKYKLNNDLYIGCEQYYTNVGQDWLTSDNGNIRLAGTKDLHFIIDYYLPYIKPATEYYWYVGQTEPTSSNYTTLADKVTEYPTTFEYKNTSGKRGYAYIILHNNKTLTAVEKVSQATVNFTTDLISIPNYTIYKSTAGMAINGVMVITIK